MKTKDCGHQASSKYYCKNCNETICFDCIEKHPGHILVKYQKVEISQTLQDFNEIFQDIKRTFESQRLILENLNSFNGTSDELEQLKRNCKFSEFVQAFQSFAKEYRSLKPRCTKSTETLTQKIVQSPQQPKNKEELKELIVKYTNKETSKEEKDEILKNHPELPQIIKDLIEQRKKDKESQENSQQAPKFNPIQPQYPMVRQLEPIRKEVEIQRFNPVPTQQIQTPMKQVEQIRQVEPIRQEVEAPILIDEPKQEQTIEVVNINPEKPVLNFAVYSKSDVDDTRQSNKTPDKKRHLNFAVEEQKPSKITKPNDNSWASTFEKVLEFIPFTFFREVTLNPNMRSFDSLIYNAKDFKTEDFLRFVDLIERVSIERMNDMFLKEKKIDAKIIYKDKNEFITKIEKFGFSSVDIIERIDQGCIKQLEDMLYNLGSSSLLKIQNDVFKTHNISYKDKTTMIKKILSLKRKK